MAQQVKGIDVILTGHTHDAIPAVIPVGSTLLVAAGSHGKFLARLDLDVKDGRVANYSFKLIPVLSDAIAPDSEMAAEIEKIRAPHKDVLGRVLGRADSLLYRRGNFNGTFDDLICDALIKEQRRRNRAVARLPLGSDPAAGRQDITMEDVYNQTAITYPYVYRTEMTGETLKDDAGGCCRQPVQSRSLLPAGRRHGAGRRHEPTRSTPSSQSASASPTCG